MKRIRVLFILSDLETGGAQRVMLTVMRHLNRDVFEPWLFTIRSDGPLRGEVPEDVGFCHGRSERVRSSFPSILRTCRDLRPQHVISTMAHLNVYLLVGRFLLPPGTRLLVREANTPTSRLRATKHAASYRSLYRLVYPMADAVICNCLSVEKDLIENFCVPFEKTVVIPNPVDTERIRALGLGAKRPYQDGRIDIISVGRLIQQKGYDLLLRGLKVAVSRVPEIQLTIVGEGPEETVLRKLARSLEIENNVTFAGGQGNPYPYISNADLFVSSSRWEGCPNVILESLACGTPVLAFDCPGGTGEIIRDGKNGWLVPPGDEVALGNRMAVLVENGEYRNVDRKRLLPRQFECRSVVDRYEALFKGADPG